ncbi:MAG: flagellar export chaperone FliS [Planctomycetaceae bacterium]|jgi:flagellar protein FliS|nr:flagellar export chaperone FliS [Planctomycetaceae bacterium]
MQQTNSARNSYIQSEIATATPQKLQLLLVEAAIKNIHRTKQAWRESKFDVGIESLSLAHDIVSEILCSLNSDSNPTIAKQLAAIYLFIFRRLAEAGMGHDEGKLDDALRVLNSERETWRQVCEKFGSTTTQTGNSADTNNRISNGGAAEFTPSAQIKPNLSSPVSPAANFSVAPNNLPNNSPPPTSGGYQRQQPIGQNSFAKPSGSYGIRTAAFPNKPTQTDNSKQTNNTTDTIENTKNTLSGIQTNNSLATPQKNQNPPPIRKNPYQ